LIQCFSIALECPYADPSSNTRPATSNQQPATSNQQPATKGAISIQKESPRPRISADEVIDRIGREICQIRRYVSRPFLGNHKKRKEIDIYHLVIFEAESYADQKRRRSVKARQGFSAFAGRGIRLSETTGINFVKIGRKASVHFKNRLTGHSLLSRRASKSIRSIPVRLSRNT
jgi:hypothetical protein